MRVMTPEEYAKYLVEQFMPFVSGGMEDSDFQVKQSAKKGAMIVLCELRKNLRTELGKFVMDFDTYLKWSGTGEYLTKTREAIYNL